MRLESNCFFSYKYPNDHTAYWKEAAFPIIFWCIHFFINQGSIVLYKSFSPIILFVYPVIPYCFLSNNSLYRYTSFLINYFLVALGLCRCMQAFLKLGGVGATLCCCARASDCSGFSCCRAQALGAWASVIAARGLSSWGLWALEHGVSSYGSRVTPQHAESSLTRDRTHGPWFGMGVLSTVPPREVLGVQDLGVPYCLVCTVLGVQSWVYHIVFLITILHNRFYYLIGKSSSFTLCFKIVLVIIVPLYFPINFIDSPGVSDG